MTQGSTLRKDRLYADKILQSKLEFEIQYELYSLIESTDTRIAVRHCITLAELQLMSAYNHAWASYTPSSNDFGLDIGIHKHVTRLIRNISGGMLDAIFAKTGTSPFVR